MFSLQTAMQDEQNKLNKIVKHAMKTSVSREIRHKTRGLSQWVYQEMRASLRSIIERGITSLRPKNWKNARRNSKLKYQLSLIGGIDEEVVKEYEEQRPVTNRSQPN